MVQDFITTVQNKKIAPTVEDKLVWKRSTNGTFSVKSCFNLLEGESCFSTPSKLFWNSSVFKSGVFCLGSLVRQSSNHEPAEEEEFSPS